MKVLSRSRGPTKSSGRSEVAALHLRSQLGGPTQPPTVSVVAESSSGLCCSSQVSNIGFSASQSGWTAVYAAWPRSQANF